MMPILNKEEFPAKSESFSCRTCRERFFDPFLQRHFKIGYIETGKLQRALVCNKKIVRAFLTDDALCKG